MEKGFLSLVLHAHLPFIRHPDHDDYLEERWFYEAISDSYIPLLETMEGWLRDGIKARITVNLSPTLLTMLADPLMMERFDQYLDRLTLLAELEVDRTRGNAAFEPLAKLYRERYYNQQSRFRNFYQGNLLSSFKRLAQAGVIEPITCPATHGYLPLMRLHPATQHAQFVTGIQVFEENFGYKPRGIWLSECAYHPGLEEHLARLGISYFLTDAHGILHAEPQPRYGIYAPLRTPSGVAAFGRDPASSKQVWSRDEGYPGDPDYREYYRDIGFDLDFETIRPFIHPKGIRLHTGFKYFRITERDSDDKQPYVPAWAEAKTTLHAANFLYNRSKQVEFLNNVMDRPPIIVCPYDAELFGHWWFEGPRFLDQVIRQRNTVNPNLIFCTPGDYLDLYQAIQPAIPGESSWGADGYHEVWLEESNHWLYRHLHLAAERMTRLAGEEAASGHTLRRRALNQMARELLLAQSSDWAFIMKTKTMVEYAVNRSVFHLNNCSLLYDMLTGEKALEENIIADLEDRSNLFPNLDYTVYGLT